MDRGEHLQTIIQRSEPWDIAVVGGGATGLGIAVDAATRGYSVALFEQSDFAKGTSSRSTKLVHGGVRYLKQGNLSLVRESLKERGLLLRNAPHLVHDLSFIIPSYKWWEKLFYGVGMKIYDLLSGKYSFGSSRLLSRKSTLQLIPTLKTEELRGGVLYHDGQFDDARLAIALAQTAADEGACVLNYARVTSLSKNREGMVDGLAFCDEESGTHYPITARAVINATGAFCDALRRADDRSASPIVALSQGAHIVLRREFLQGNTAIMVPQTSDGRVMFAIPWHGHVVVGTTDTPIPHAGLEPRALEEEIDFMLDTAGAYLAKRPTRADILSVFAGVRPLVGTKDKTQNTAKLSRDHTIQISPSGLITITGGKWTTYRHMAEDAVNQAAATAKLPPKPCVTRERQLYGYDEHADEFGNLSVYGSDAPGLLILIKQNPDLREQLHPELPIIGAQVVWAARHEMARTIEDVLARRTRALFLNQAAAVAMAPAVAQLMAVELGRDESWQQEQIAEFRTVAEGFSAALAPAPTATTP